MPLHVDTMMPIDMVSYTYIHTAENVIEMCEFFYNIIRKPKVFVKSIGWYK